MPDISKIIIKCDPQFTFLIYTEAHRFEHDVKADIGEIHYAT